MKRVPATNQRNGAGSQPTPPAIAMSGDPRPLDHDGEKAKLICDLSRAYAHSPAHSGPAPVLAAFGTEPLSDCVMRGAWDFDRAIRENRDKLLRSVRVLGGATMSDKWDDIIFQFGGRSFLYGSPSRIIGYASTPEEAERIVRDFTETYGTAKNPAGGSFQLIRKEQYGEITCESVGLAAETVLEGDVFALHYPDDAGEWHSGFVEKLLNRKSGLSILEGRPGTGKTSYLRHLMGCLKESHRFYFIPPMSLQILEEPDFIGFWSTERERYSERKLVVILEDADAALMVRESDNRDRVGAILNLSDGMLSDFRCLHVICTINCTASDIDPALLRPGRLVSHRVFRRLEKAQAKALAESIGTTLPPADDYSLAEVFAGGANEPVSRPRVGFQRA